MTIACSKKPNAARIFCGLARESGRSEIASCFRACSAAAFSDALVPNKALFIARDRRDGCMKAGAGLENSSAGYLTDGLMGWCAGNAGPT